MSESIGRRLLVFRVTHSRNLKVQLKEGCEGAQGRYRCVGLMTAPQLLYGDGGKEGNPSLRR